MSRYENHGFFKDENGAVMVEFVIVAPFLVTVMAAVMFFGDTSRFLAATHQWSAVQAWRGVGQGLDGGNSAGFSMQSSHQIDIAGVNVNVAMNTVPLTAVKSEGTIGLGIAIATYLANGSPFEGLGININNYYKGEELRPSNLGGGTNQLRYRNSSFLTPFLGAMSSFVGNTAGTDANNPINEIDYRYTSIFSVMNDSYSVFSRSNGANRLDETDSFTVNAFLPYRGAMLVHDVISLNQTESSRKVNKGMNTVSHDINGNTPHLRGLSEKHRLKNITGGQRWEMVQ